jgi:hypothetical protein
MAIRLESYLTIPKIKEHYIFFTHIPEHFEPGSPTNLTGRAWAEILKPAIFFA